MRGDDAYQVAVGPIHAGVIESGHFRFHVVGERILHLDARLFYKHRGLERAAEGQHARRTGSPTRRAPAPPARSRTASPTPTPARRRSGSARPRELARARTILLELERIWSHLNDIAAVCAGVGLAAGNNRFAALTERARRLNARLTGPPLPLRHGRASAAATLDARRATPSRPRGRSSTAIARRVASAPGASCSSTPRSRTGSPTSASSRRDDARALGAVGPAARAAGVAEDAAHASPGSPTTASSRRRPRRAAGDVQARLEQRAVELLQTFELLDALLDRPDRAGRREHGRRRGAIGIGRVESPRGATRLRRRARRRPRSTRLRLRTGSYANWPVVAHAAADNLLPDFPLINKSFELCYACADR